MPAPMNTRESETYSNKAIWKIAAPMMASGISVPLLGFVDTAVMGHLAEAYWLAAVAAGSTLFTVLFMGMNFIRMGTTGMVAQALGSADNNQTRTLLAQSITLALVLAIALIVLQQPILEVALQLLGTDAQVSAATREYFYIRIWAAPATLSGFALIGWFLGMQNARAPLLITLTINFANILLDILFVPLAGLQITGVAWATVIAEYLGLAVSLCLLKPLLAQYPGSVSASDVWQLRSYKRMFQVNVALLLRTLTLMFTLAFVTAQGARFGAVILAANAVLMNFQMFLSYALDGIAHAAEALTGKAFGARNSDALRIVVKRTLNWSLLFAGLYTAIYLLAGAGIIDLITTIPEVRQTANDYLIWMIVSPFVSVWCFLYDGVFVGLTRSREMLIVMFASAVGVFLPVWYLSSDYGNNGLWAAFIGFMAARGVGMHLYARRILSEQPPAKP